MPADQRKLHHLLWRAGFGPSVHYTPAGNLSVETENIFSNSKTISPLFLEEWDSKNIRELRKLSDMDKAAYRKKERNARIAITEMILNRYRDSKSFLREKMTLFWIGHFACRIPHPSFVLDYYNAISKNALGNFGELLSAMTRNAALLQYLNNNQNRKSSPNENFARELMELFSLGRGNYYEQDVREGARAFTGWTFDKEGQFMIRQEHHDNGRKEFLGETGNLDADDVVRIILTKKECALFITTKIYKFFVHDNPAKADVEKLAAGFYSSGYDIEKLMRAIFSSPDFFNEKYIGSRIKSPVELLAGINRQFNVKFENPTALMQIQKILGQVLFDPPNVAGWPSGKSWIDSSTLIYRTRLPQVLLENAEALAAPREEFDNAVYDPDKKEGNKNIKTSYDLMPFTDKFSINKFKTEELCNYLLQNNVSEAKIRLLESMTSGTTGTTLALKKAIYIMSLPEYQLC
jgi:uncharacterized protein (DUF1800 family)